MRVWCTWMALQAARLAESREHGCRLQAPSSISHLTCMEDRAEPSFPSSVPASLPAPCPTFSYASASPCRRAVSTSCASFQPAVQGLSKRGPLASSRQARAHCQLAASGSSFGTTPQLPAASATGLPSSPRYVAEITPDAQPERSMFCMSDGVSVASTACR